MDITFSRKSDLSKHCKNKKVKDNVNVMESGSFQSVKVEGPSFKNRV